MFRSLFSYINSTMFTKYVLIAYSLAIFVVSGLHLKTSSHGFIYTDKIMHVAEYSILGILLIRYLIHSKKMNFKKSAIYTLVFATLFAISDEIHQGFVGFFSTGIFGGVRDPDILDVLADVVGISAGIYAYSIILTKYNKIKINGKLNEKL
ncbi:MAG: VanZ family protein [Candidatus Delongbacteria bacterium]|nr:VanZ family protein [Candidatus Delongbacteria bacterium]